MGRFSRQDRGWKSYTAWRPAPRRRQPQRLQRRRLPSGVGGGIRANSGSRVRPCRELEHQAGAPLLRACGFGGPAFGRFQSRIGWAGVVSRTGSTCAASAAAAGRAVATPPPRQGRRRTPSGARRQAPRAAGTSGGPRRQVLQAGAGPSAHRGMAAAAAIRRAPKRVASPRRRFCRMARATSAVVADFGANGYGRARRIRAGALAYRAPA